MFFECAIKKEDGNFDIFEAKEYSAEAWEDLSEMIAEARANVPELIELGVDDLPEGVPNILGRIRNQPDHVFYVANQDGGYYIGISSF